MPNPWLSNLGLWREARGPANQRVCGGGAGMEVGVGCEACQRSGTVGSARSKAR